MQPSYHGDMIISTLEGLHISYILGTMMAIFSDDKMSVDTSLWLACLILKKKMNYMDSRRFPRLIWLISIDIFVNIGKRFSDLLTIGNLESILFS